jgi:hypothetical protein
MQVALWWRRWLVRSLELESTAALHRGDGDDGEHDERRCK